MTDAPTHNDPVLTVTEACERARLSKSAILALCRKGELRHRRVGANRGRIQIYTKSLDDYLRSCEVTAPGQEQPRRSRKSADSRGFALLRQAGYRG